MAPETVAAKAMQRIAEEMKRHPFVISFCKEHGCGPVETETEERLALRIELRRLRNLYPDTYREVFSDVGGVDMRGEMLAGPTTLDVLHHAGAALGAA